MFRNNYFKFERNGPWILLLHALPLDFFKDTARWCWQKYILWRLFFSNYNQNVCGSCMTQYNVQNPYREAVLSSNGGYLKNQFHISISNHIKLKIKALPFCLKLYCGYKYTRPCMINRIWGLKRLWQQVNGHAWFHLHGLRWPVRNGEGAKNSKWKYMLPARFKPTPRQSTTGKSALETARPHWLDIKWSIYSLTVFWFMNTNGYEYLYRIGYGFITGYVEISNPTRRSEFDNIYWTPIQTQDG